LSAVFLAGAVNKIIHWHESEKTVMNALCDWQAYIGFSESAQSCFSILMPWTPLLLISATLFELVGGLLVLLGVREKLGAFLLILFLIPTTVIMHQFWFIEGSARELQTVMFLKNLAILGGLLMILLSKDTGKPGGDPFPPIKLG
jgi:uncharacterized membrane protein YphA (DoxX/SURF4 family)